MFNFNQRPFGIDKDSQRIRWFNTNAESYLKKNNALLESLDITDDFDKYDFFIDNYKFETKYHFGRSYDYYQKLIYESLTCSYDIFKFKRKLEELDVVSKIIFEEDDIGVNYDYLLVYTYNDNDTKAITKLCDFYGYYIASMEKIGSKYCYIIESKYGLTEETDLIYTEFNGICYHVTQKQNLNKIQKIGLYTKAKCKQAFHPERIYLISGYNTDNDALSAIRNSIAPSLYPNNDYVILKIDLSKNNFKIRMFMDPAYPNYGVFTYESISPRCISVLG